EQHVLRVLAAFQRDLPREAQDVLALATSFRQPPTERRLLEYLASAPLRAQLHEHWARTYVPFRDRPPAWLAAQVELLVALRLLERVPGGASADAVVVDAHPLVRRGFEGVLGAGQHPAARARLLHGPPGRPPPRPL